MWSYVLISAVLIFSSLGLCMALIRIEKRQSMSHELAIFLLDLRNLSKNELSHSKHRIFRAII